MTNAMEAIQEVLNEAAEPLHYKEITRRILDRGLWRSDGQTPDATINAQLTIHIKKHGDNARIRRCGSGLYAIKCKSSNDDDAASVPPANGSNEGSVSFTDAAEAVLKEHAHGRSMHYRKITGKALELGLVQTSGRTPEATMYASVLQEIQRFKKRGKQPRFQMLGQGQIALAKSLPLGIAAQIERENKRIRDHLHGRLMEMHFAQFEELVGFVLAKLGFEEVSVTSSQGDKGIDVRGTIVVGEAIRIRMAVQLVVAMSPGQSRSRLPARTRPWPSGSFGTGCVRSCSLPSGICCSAQPGRCRR